MNKPKEFKLIWIELLIVILFAVALSWIDPLYSTICVLSFLGTRYIVPLVTGTENKDEALNELTEQKSNVNENIEKYIAELRQKRKNAAWWQFWL